MQSYELILIKLKNYSDDMVLANLLVFKNSFLNINLNNLSFIVKSQKCIHYKFDFI